MKFSTKTTVFLYLLPMSLGAILCIPIELCLVLMGSMVSDSGSIGATFLAMGVLALIPMGTLGCILRSWHLYARKKYRAAIGWNVPSTILTLIALLLFSGKFFLIILFGLWLCIGFWLMAKNNMRRNCDAF